MNMIISEEAQKECMTVRRIREQDQNQIRTFKVLVVYFSLLLLTKLIQLVVHWVSGSPIDSLWSCVALSILSVVAIPILIYRIKRIRATDYYISVNDLVDIAKKRYKPLESTLLLVAGFLLLLILFVPSIADGNRAFIWGCLSGVVLGSIICYRQRTKFIRLISNV